MKDWLSRLEECARADCPAILVTIADAKGSAPREAGVKMLVTATDMAGTVGGGNLEHEAIRIARGMLAAEGEQSELRRFALGPSLGQCCGGDTRLLFEPVPTGAADWITSLRAFTGTETPSVLISAIDGGERTKRLIGSRDLAEEAGGSKLLAAAAALLKKPDNAGARLWADGDGQRYLLEQNPGHRGHVLLIGAGHVGKAIANILGTLPFAVTWADNRPEQYPDTLPANVRPRCTPHLEQAIDEAAPNTLYLVMTYSHDLDYALCARVLQRADFRYLGLIGSRTKRARFEKTMLGLGINRSLIDRVVCPIGIDGIDGKQPAIIAVATAAQLLALVPGKETGPPARTDDDRFA